jgi:hypothetical protein
MCRNIRILFNFEPPTTEQEIQAAALQFVRKVSGTRAPSKANQASFDAAVKEVAAATRKLLGAMTTEAPPRTREEEARKGKLRAQKRYSLAPPR